jgi:hypothetical protein
MELHNQAKDTARFVAVILRRFLRLVAIEHLNTGQRKRLLTDLGNKLRDTAAGVASQIEGSTIVSAVQGRIGEKNVTARRVATVVFAPIEDLQVVAIHFSNRSRTLYEFLTGVVDYPDRVTRVSAVEGRSLAPVVSDRYGAASDTTAADSFIKGWLSRVA